MGILLQAAAGEKAAAEEAAKLLQKAGEESEEEKTPEKGDQKRMEEKRLVMQAMHVPHEDPGSSCLNESCITGMLSLRHIQGDTKSLDMTHQLGVVRKHHTYGIISLAAANGCLAWPFQGVLTPTACSPDRAHSAMFSGRHLLSSVAPILNDGASTGSP